MYRSLAKTVCVVFVMSVVCVFFGVMAASGFASGPALRLNLDVPDTVTAGEEVFLPLKIQNVGDQTTNAPITFTFTGGPGLIAPSIGDAPGLTSSSLNVPVKEAKCEPLAGDGVACVAPGPLPPGAQMSMIFTVTVQPGAEGQLSGTISVSGGGAVGVVRDDLRMTVGPPGSFAFDEAAVRLLNTDGSPDMQAGSVPAEYTTTLRWKSFSTSVLQKSQPILESDEHVKDVVAHLPPGFIGNPSATPTLCTDDQLRELDGSSPGPNCPFDSQIGVAHIYLAGLSTFTPLYNMVAPYGVASQLGFRLFSTVVILFAYVRPGDHGIDVISRDTSTSVPLPGAEITVWGNPSDHSHDRYRNLCLDYSLYEGPNGGVCPTAETPQAFLRTPTSCSGSPLAFGAESNSYEHEDVWARADFPGPVMQGCESVPFTPSITVSPTGTAANSPTGVTVKLSVPQSRDPVGLAQADLKKAVVTLPEGMAINPSAADGLAACDDAHLHLDSNTPAECPNGSKIGTVLLHTQLIPTPIEGSVYLRPQNSNDPMSGEMFRMVIELRDDAHGLDFKIPGHVQANPVTGRLTTTFDNNPQFPFEDINLKFKAGARAPLVTPAACETQTTEARLYPYSRPEEPVYRSNSFALTSGPEGTPCLTTQGLAPGFSAGVASVQAGGFTPFLTTFVRKDTDQSVKSVSVTLPLGLSGSLVGLPLCPDALAASGKCEAASEIGTVTAGAGAGPTPFYVTGGKVFMTGPYEGAPFGLSIVVPTKAGPFDLGNVVVRARVEVDPRTAQLTVTSNAIPVIVSGVPVNVRLVNVTVNRSKFVFNPTNCNPLSVTGSMTGGQGAVAHLQNHFQVTNCAALAFKPSFSVSTAGKTSRVSGASLAVKLSYPKDAFGKDANIARVKVDLPKQLPSRLTTLQKACTDATFNRNPAACPPASRVGTAKAVTPIVPVPLEGPAYFVSHGGAKFPELIIVLQGYGVTVHLDGETFINEKTSITSSTFPAVPDVPVGTFELHLPQGPNSALAANGNLCKAKLKMPTMFVAQNGAILHQNTPIAVTGCARHKAKKASPRGRRHGRH